MDHTEFIPIEEDMRQEIDEVIYLMLIAWVVLPHPAGPVIIIRDFIC
jgi:hypothetical protein